MSTEGSRLVSLCPVFACPDLPKTVKFYIEKLGYGAYIDPAAPEGVDFLYEEFSAQEVKIVAKPHMTEYGSYEFVIEDPDGRQLGIGLIVDRPTFFLELRFGAARESVVNSRSNTRSNRYLLVNDRDSSG